VAARVIRWFRENQWVRGKDRMNKIFVAVIVAVSALATAATVLAGAGNVSYTVHNMSSTNPGGLNRFIQSATEDQICIFCHTPHNARPAVPLWNKVMPSQAFNMYTSSYSLSPAAKAVTAPGPESLLCLSCHDGRTAINVLHNTRNASQTVNGAFGPERVVAMDMLGVSDPSTPANGNDGLPAGVGITIGLFGFGNYGANIGKLGDGSSISDSTYGGNLMDDHPISFSYDAAQGSKPTKLNSRVVVGTKSSNAIRFFGPNNRLECSSCHDPHIPYGFDRMGPTGVGNPDLRPFLVMGNSGSALCLACHNK
jgi:hypothetical protein